jgi:hypothetical protein
MEFLPYWLATFFPYPETNWCIRSKVLKKMYPDDDPDDFFSQYSPTLKLRYNLNTSGYLTCFLPIVACFTRDNKDSLGNSSKWRKINKKAEEKNIAQIIQYRKDFLSGREKHVFRDGSSKIIKTILPHELEFYEKKILNYRKTQENYCGYRDQLYLNS